MVSDQWNIKPSMSLTGPYGGWFWHFGKMFVACWWQCWQLVSELTISFGRAGLDCYWAKSLMSTQWCSVSSQNWVSIFGLTLGRHSSQISAESGNRMQPGFFFFSILNLGHCWARSDDGDGWVSDRNRVCNIWPNSGASFILSLSRVRQLDMAQVVSFGMLDLGRCWNRSFWLPGNPQHGSASEPCRAAVVVVQHLSYWKSSNRTVFCQRKTHMSQQRIKLQQR